MSDPSGMIMKSQFKKLLDWKPSHFYLSGFMKLQTLQNHGITRRSNHQWQVECGSNSQFSQSWRQIHIESPSPLSKTEFTGVADCTLMFNYVQGCHALLFRSIAWPTPLMSSELFHSPKESVTTLTSTRSSTLTFTRRQTASWSVLGSKQWRLADVCLGSWRLTCFRTCLCVIGRQVLALARRHSKQ